MEEEKLKRKQDEQFAVHNSKKKLADTPPMAVPCCDNPRIGIDSFKKTIRDGKSWHYLVWIQNR